jgi:phosphatidylinositol alpha-1,6-mannosyltransferase
MACGKPVVAFDIEPHKEIVKEEVGLLVPQGNCRALAEAIIKILIDHELAQKMGCAGYERVKKEFVWKKSTENFLNILKEVIDK